MAQIIRLSCLIYRQLLIFYPPELRSRFGSDMAEVFEDLSCDVADRHGLIGLLLLWRSALWELLSVAVSGRLHKVNVTAASLSLVASLALFLGFFRAVS